MGKTNYKYQLTGFAILGCLAAIYILYIYKWYIRIYLYNIYIHVYILYVFKTDK